MLALLPPSSRVTRLTCAAAPAITLVPTSVDPVNTILRTSGWATKRSPTTEPLPGNTANRSAGSPASTASSPSRMGVSGVHPAGLTSPASPAPRPPVPVRVDWRGEGAQCRRALGGRQSCPVPLRRLGACHRVIHPGLVGLIDGAQQFLGGRVDHITSGHAFTFPVAYAVAASTTAANNRRSSSRSSGCHCTYKP